MRAGRPNSLDLQDLPGGDAVDPAEGFSDRRVAFVVAGTQKGGTTSLDRYLREHPALSMARVKEVRFFDDERNFVDSPDYARYHAYFEPPLRGRIAGEATPNYMYALEAPARLREYNPEMKTICVLRNPIERAYSQWNMETQLGRENRPFFEAICIEGSEPGRTNGRDPQPSYLERGRYAGQLARLAAQFPSEQILVLRSEELRAEPLATMNRVYRFLGVEQANRVEAKRAHERRYERPMSRAERAYLREALESEIREVERLLGWDCSAWMEDRPA